MRRGLLLVALSWGTLPLAAQAQVPGWDATFFIDPFPSPYVSDWEMNPTMATLTVTNGTGQDAYVVVRLTVTDQSGREVLRTRTDPLFIPAGVPTTFHSGSELTGGGRYDSDLEDVIAHTGRFPEGDYLVCVTVAADGGPTLVDELCEFFSAVLPAPPDLMFPMDRDTVRMGDPVFEWLPIDAPVTLETRYVVQVAEIRPGQQPHTAVTAGIPHFRGRSFGSPFLTYPLGENPLEHGKRYAWWVQALGPSGLPLTTNQGRSEVWTFTYFDEGGGAGGTEEVGGSLHGRIVHHSTSPDGPLANLGTASFQAIRTELNRLPDNEIPIPLPISGVGIFQSLPLSDVRVEVDDPSQSIAIGATAVLPMGSVQLLLLGQWEGSDVGSFLLAIDPLFFHPGEWIEGLDGTVLDGLDWSGGILTIADGSSRTLDAALLPQAVEAFYQMPTVPVEAGVSLSHVVDLRGTPFQERLGRVGLEVTEAEFTGSLGIDPEVLFRDREKHGAPALDLTASLRGGRLAHTPEWLHVESYAIRVTNDPGLALGAEMEARAELGSDELSFLLALDLEEEESPVLTGGMTAAWEAPFGIEWLVLDEVLMTLTAPDAEGEGGSAVLEGTLGLGSQTVRLTGMLAGGEDEMEATFTASLDEFSVGDLMAFLESHFGSHPLGEQVPDDLATLQDVAVELRSGDPPTLSILGTALVLGQGTDFLYTFVPPTFTGDGEGAGLVAIRLPDWSLGNLIPALEGSPFGDFRFPSLSLARGPPGDPPEPPGEDEPEESAVASGGWSIPWPNLGGPARGFFSRTHPCADEGPDCGSGSEEDDPEGDDRGSLNLRPGLNFTAPFSLAQLPSGIGSLLSFGTGAGGSNGDDDEPADPVVIQGSPGISLSGLMSGAPDLSGLLNLRATLPPLPAGTLGLPDWMVPRSRSIRIFQDPEVRMVARAVVDADLDGSKRFHLAADLSSVDGGGAAFEGLMEGGWREPFGLTWLALDSVHMAVGVGSVGARVALGSNIEIGSATGALALEVKGPSGDRSLDLEARVRDLSTTDVVSFLNQAFNAGLPTPTSSVQVDSLRIGFSSGETEAFHLVGAFSAELDPAEALLALADMLPGFTPPSEIPFELGPLGEAWFELLVVADSVRGGFGGTVALGGNGEAALLEGSAAVRVGALRASDSPWIELELDLVGRNLESQAAIAALSTALSDDWTLPEGLRSMGNLVLDSARVRMELDSRSGSAGAELAGSGLLDGETGRLSATVELGVFVEDGEEGWATGTMRLALLEVPMSTVLAEAAAALPGEWRLPEALDAMAPVRLDSASLALGFDSRADSLSVDARGAGTMGGEEGAEASTRLTLVRTAEGEWAAGRLAIGIGTISLPDALARGEELLAGDWRLPSAISGLAPVMLDGATLAVAFDSRTSTFTTDITGAAHLGEGANRMDGSIRLSLVAAEGEQFARGSVTLGVGELALTAVLEEVGTLLPGGWALPEGLTAFDDIRLREADLFLGFDTRADSLSARTRGSGSLGPDGSGLAADADITFLRLAEGSGAFGTVELGQESITMTQALERIAELLPGTWELPEGTDAFENVSLDRADFVLGFDSRADSLFAAVSGSGGFEGLEAAARLGFLRMPQGDRATGLIGLELGSVGAAQAVERIATLLPGTWSLPAGFEGFDALALDEASLEAGFDTRADSLWAGFQGSGRLDDVSADARLAFVRAGGSAGGSGLVTLGLGDVSSGDAFNRATGLLPGDWQVPSVDFPIGDLRDVRLELGFDTSADSIWAGVEATAQLAGREGRATLAALSVGGLSGTPRSWAEGSFRVDVGEITLPRALELAAGLVPGSPAIPELEFDLGGIRDGVLEAGFRTGDDAGAWTGLSGGFRLGPRTARAEMRLALGEDRPQGHFRATFDESFAVRDVVDLMTGFLPGASIELPPLGPLDVSIDQPRLTLSLGDRTGVSFAGATELFGKSGVALFSFSRIGGRPQLILGVQVPDLGFDDLVPGFDNPITEQVQLALAALTVTRAEGSVDSEDLTEEERTFFRPVAGGGDSFSLDFNPGLNLTGLLPLDGTGALKDMVDMLTPGATDLTLQGTLPLPGFGAGGIRSLSLNAALPPMAPPGSPEWFVEGQVALQISGRPSVGLAGALTLDVSGDTLTFDIDSNVAVVPAGVELSIAGGLAAARPWVGPLGIEWLTLNEIRLAMGLNPVSVRLGFLGDAIIGEKDIRMALGTRINIYTGVPIGALVLGESAEGLALSDLMRFQEQVAGPDARTIPVDALPNMEIRELGIRVATYTDFDLGVEAGIGLRGTFLLQTDLNGTPSEFGRIDLSVDREGVIGLARLSSFSVGPVRFDEALLDLALTLEEQHLVVEGGAMIENFLSADIALAMNRDSLRFSTEFDLFDQFRADLHAQAAFDLTNPSFMVRASLHPQFNDELLYGVAERLIPSARLSLVVASAALEAAEESLETAEVALDGAVWLASEASREAMDATYVLYQSARRNYNTADSNWNHHRRRCDWRNPGHCAARNYWAGVRSTRRAQRNVRWTAYTVARSTYENRGWFESNPAVVQARSAMDGARVAFSSARTEVDRLEATVTHLGDWMERFDECPTCPRPPIPFEVLSAEAGAELAGFFGRSSVDLTVRYQLFGERHTVRARFGGSISDLSGNLYSVVSNALF